MSTLYLKLFLPNSCPPYSVQFYSVMRFSYRTLFVQHLWLQNYNWSKTEPIKLGSSVVLSDKAMKILGEPKAEDQRGWGCCGQCCLWMWPMQGEMSKEAPTSWSQSLAVGDASAFRSELFLPAAGSSHCFALTPSWCILAAYNPQKTLWWGSSYTEEGVKRKRSQWMSCIKKIVSVVLFYHYLVGKGGIAEWSADPQGLRAAAHRQGNDHLHLVLLTDHRMVPLLRTTPRIACVQNCDSVTKFSQANLTLWCGAVHLSVPWTLLEHSRKAERATETHRRMSWALKCAESSVSGERT